MINEIPLKCKTHEIILEVIITTTIVDPILNYTLTGEILALFTKLNSAKFYFFPFFFFWTIKSFREFLNPLISEIKFRKHFSLRRIIRYYYFY